MEIVGISTNCTVTPNPRIGGTNETAAALPDPLVPPQRVLSRVRDWPAPSEDAGAVAGG